MATTVDTIPTVDDARRALRERRYAELASLPDQPPAWRILAGAAGLAGLGQFRSGLEQARASLQQALEPLGRAEAMKWVGLVLLGEGHPELARGWLEQSVGLDAADAETAAALERCRAPGYLAPEAWSSAQGETFLRHRPRESGAQSDYIYSIDIVGTCNLRCPTCPVGNTPLEGRSRGFMPPQLFARILAKIQAESPSSNPQIWLFNWGEPLLHPKLPQIIDQIRAAGLRSYLSSNLNIHKGLDEVIAANPTDLKISLSGASARTYEKTHVRGKFATVENNMRKIRAALDRHGSTTHVWVGHHVYQHNRHELDRMQALCNELNFDHHPVPAFYQPLEALVALAENPAAPEPEILDLLLEHPRSYLQRFARVRDRRFDCELRFNQTVINHDGSVALCCSVYTQPNQLAVNFLDEPHARIEGRKYDHDFCTRCYRHGLQYAPSRVHDVRDSS